MRNKTFATAVRVARHLCMSLSCLSACCVKTGCRASVRGTVLLAGVRCAQARMRCVGRAAGRRHEQPFWKTSLGTESSSNGS
jgi:hypothetical protein